MRKDPSAATTVVVDLTATLVSDEGDHVPLPVSLRYRLADPYAVQVIFSAPSLPVVTWVFARELLASGMYGAAGIGDVTVWCSSSEELGDVYIGLASPDGEALLYIPGPEVATFLGKTYARCLPGDEHIHVDVDLAIKHLLAS